MEQILVKRANNSEYLLEDKNKGSFITSIIQSTELRSNDVINIEVSSREFINFTIGDSFHYLGQKYTLNQIPRYFKNSSNDFQFSITFEGVMFDLRRASYDVNIDTTGSAIYGETLTADLELFATILIENINRVFPGKWVLGEIPAETETKTITFSEEENCLAALQMLCDEYDTDFIIKTDNDGVNILNFKQVGDEIPLEFKVGFQKGLYTLTREKVDTSDIVTRLKVYGSDKNLGTDYRANRLVLKDKNKPNSYIENTQAVAKYGIYESTKIFDDIYPRRKGKVTSINSESVYKFSDLSMDFDLNEKENGNTKYIIPSTPPKIHFNTGNLAGYELEIHDYNHETKEFHIVKFADENGYEFPSKDNDAFRIGIDDEYVILDIQMPQIYIDNAEAELFEKADEYLSDKLEPNIQYLLDVDTLHLQRILNDTVTQFFSIGDFIKVIDEDFDINRYIRIKSIERDLRNPFDYKLTLSDSKVTNFLNGTILGEINNINKIIKINNLNNPAKARRNWKDAQEVLNMVFDVEGDYYTEKIKPNSIETTHLQVGAKSMQFNLIDSFFEPNFEGNPNKMRWSTCKLVHFTISDKIVDWQIQGGQKDLESNKPYYLYAKCNKSNNIGVIEITETQYVVDQGNFYYFLIGIINSYSEDVKAREISLMYGFTTVSGRFIKTGRIESSGGGTYFDLDTGEISGKITFTSDSPAFNQVKDSIQIGGRNLITGLSQHFETSNGWYYYSLSERLIEGESYYISGEISNPNGSILAIGLNLNNGVNYNYIPLPLNQSFIATAQMTWLDKFCLAVQTENGIVKFSNFKLEKGNKATDWTPAPEDVDNAINDVKIKAEQAISQLTSIANDNILSPSEKQQISNEWNRIKSEYVSNYSLGISNGVDTTNLTNAYNDLFNYINPLLVDISVESSIVGDVFRAKFKAYYDQNIALLVAINDKIKQGINNNASNITNLSNSIARINQITSFLNTTVNGNVIGTGVLMVGSETQSNAFISGLTDKGNESIRFAAGKSYQEKEKSPFQVLDNGLVRFCNPENGKVVFELGAKMGKVVFDIYNEQGIKTATIGPQGIVFTGYTPENYDKQRFRRLTYQSDNETELINEVLNYSKILYNQYDGTFKHMLNNAETYAYQYSAGYNFESANNAQYEGKYFQDENKLGAFMQDGWYATYYENIITQSINVNIYCQIILINSGRIIKQYIVSETKPWNWFDIF